MKLITIGDQSYVLARKLSAFDQLHLARKLGPAMPIVEGLVSPANVDKDKALLTVLALSHVSDADTEYVVRKCLGVVNRVQGTVSSKLMTDSGEMMFDDVTMNAMLELAVAVIEDNLGDFFRTTLAGLAAQRTLVPAS